MLYCCGWIWFPVLRQGCRELPKPLNMIRCSVMGLFIADAVRNQCMTQGAADRHPVVPRGRPDENWRGATVTQVRVTHHADVTRSWSSRFHMPDDTQIPLHH